MLRNSVRILLQILSLMTNCLYTHNIHGHYQHSSISSSTITYIVSVIYLYMIAEITLHVLPSVGFCRLIFYFSTSFALATSFFFRCKVTQHGISDSPLEKWGVLPSSCHFANSMNPKIPQNLAQVSRQMSYYSRYARWITCSLFS